MGEHVWLLLFPVKTYKKESLELSRTKRQKEQQLSYVKPVRGKPVPAPKPRESSGLEALDLALKARGRRDTEANLNREFLGHSLFRSTRQLRPTRLTSLLQFLCFFPITMQMLYYSFPRTRHPVS